MSDIPVSMILLLILLLLCAGLFAIVFKRLRFPYTIGLVLVGLLLGSAAGHVEGLAFLRKIHFTPNLVLYILLPTLVFDAALNLDTRLLLKTLIPVLALAAPGLILATLLTGGILQWLTPLSLGAALLFGALISATDPVAVIAVFKELGAPRRLTMLVDGESLFNDATAMVMFDIILAMLAGGAALGLGIVVGAGARFFAVFLGGTLVGALVGLLMVRILLLAQDDPLIEIAFTAVIAYIAFILAQFYLGLSGVMAVVAAGLVVAYYGDTCFPPHVKKQLKHFWEFACFAANSYIFLLLGMTEGYLVRSTERLTRSALVVVTAILVVTLARAILLYGLVPLINKATRKRPIGMAYRHMMLWGGLRGALPIALAMSLTPEQVGGELNRTLILDCTLGVVLFTLLVQGTTIGRLMKRLQLNALSPLEHIQVRTLGLALEQKGLATIDTIAAKWPALDSATLENARQHYRTATARHTPPACTTPPPPETITERALWMLILSEINTSYRQLFEQGLLPPSLLRKLERHLETCRDEVSRGSCPPPARPRSTLRERLLSTYLARTRQKDCPSPLTTALDKQLTATTYASHLATTTACEHTLAILPHLCDICNAPPDATDQCARWLRTHRDDAIGHIRLFMQHAPDRAAELQTAAITRLARQTELENLEELRTRGALSDRLAHIIQRNIP